MFFDAKEYHTANKQVANILKEAEATNTDEKVEEVKEEATADQLEGTNWGDEEEIDIDMGDDPAIAADQPELAAELDNEFFVPPNHGADPIVQALKQNPQNVGLHVAAGEFTKALELLRKHLAINDFSALKQSFVDVHTLSKMKMQTMPHSLPMDYRMRFIN